MKISLDKSRLDKYDLCMHIKFLRDCHLIVMKTSSKLGDGVYEYFTTFRGGSESFSYFGKLDPSPPPGLKMTSP